MSDTEQAPNLLELVRNVVARRQAYATADRMLHSAASDLETAIGYYEKMDDIAVKDGDEFFIISVSNPSRKPAFRLDIQHTSDMRP